MKTINKIFLPLFICFFLFHGCGENEARNSDSTGGKMENVKSSSAEVHETPKVTFVELGSVNCIPCRMMQPVMEAIEKEFGNQIKVVFHDVWKDNAPAKKYGIKVIPTQVFLDESGNEFFRHEGYLPKEEIEKLLLDKGLKVAEQVSSGKK